MDEAVGMKVIVQTKGFQTMALGKSFVFSSAVNTSYLKEMALLSTCFFEEGRDWLVKMNRENQATGFWKILISERLRCSKARPLRVMSCCVEAFMCPMITPVGICFLGKKDEKEEKNPCSQCPKIT